MTVLWNPEEWGSRNPFTKEIWNRMQAVEWNGGAIRRENRKSGDDGENPAVRTVVVTCSDRGIAAAEEAGLPAVAVRNRIFDQNCGVQSLFGTPVLLERAEDIDDTLLQKIWKRYYGIPLVIGGTARCLIREICESDIPVLYEVSGGVINERGPESCRLEQEEYKTFWQAYIKNQYGFFGYGLWLITRKEPGRKNTPVGLAGFPNTGELGYWIFPEFRRKGYAKEACCFLLAYAKKTFGWETITLHIKKENLPSRHLAESMGFHFAAECERAGGQMQKWIFGKEREAAQDQSLTAESTVRL